jgi:uncharacterized protein (DUF927 family)
MRFRNVSFNPPIEQLVIHDIKLIVPKASLNSKNEVSATVQIHNGTLAGLDTFSLDKNLERLTFSSMMRRQKAIPNDDAAEGALNDALRSLADVVSKQLLELLESQGRSFPHGAVACDFICDDRGLFHRSQDQKGAATEPFWICSPIEIVAHTRDEESENWGRLLEITDLEGMTHRWAMPMRMLAGDGRDYLSVLLDMGLRISPDRQARMLLTHFISTAAQTQYARSVERLGWHGDAFVLPDEVIGSTGGELVCWQHEDRGRCTHRSYAQQGDLEGWKREVAALSPGNTILTFSVSLAFAGPLLRLTGDENGGFHLRGPSSKGKTSTALVAGSVCGPKAFVQTWRATANGLEGVAAQRNDTLLILDEMKQVEPKECGQVAYMLASGSGKQRSNAAGGARERQQWRSLLLSTGEIGLADHMRDAGRRTYAGEQIRLIDIPAIEEEHGAFGELHGSADGAAFSRRLVGAAQQYHGTALRAFLHRLTSEPDIEKLKAQIAESREAFISNWLPSNADGQISRAAWRFSLVAVAGELATNLGITGWLKGEATVAARTCFRRWLRARGGSKAMEDIDAFEQVRIFIEQHGEDRFTPWQEYEQTADDQRRDPQRTYDRVGFRRENDETGVVEYYFLPESFRKVVCQGVDHKVAIAALDSRGWLVRDSDGRPTRKERLPGMAPTRCYRVVPKEVVEDIRHDIGINEDWEDETEVDDGQQDEKSAAAS